MDHIVFLIMRRMRAPLLVLIASYTVAITGLVLIPSQDAAGNPAPLSFFHAFYIVAYTSTTIGFGELPFAFTDAQRLWMSVVIFFTVGVWIYAVGTLIGLLQDVTLKRALAEGRFRRRVQRLGDPFYLVCGFGQTGGALVRALTDRHQHAVVVDIDPERISLLALENQREYVPALCGDARRPSNLDAAGLKHPLCQGVVALTNVNETNLKIAIAAKLLHPDIQVICRSDSHEVEANMRSFGTDHVYDPFDTFALYMATAIEAPCTTLLSDWLTGLTGEALKEPIYPPGKGTWVICGYGRFGKAIYRHLKEEGLALRVIEAEPHHTGIPKEGVVQGRGTEAPTLQEAEIERAVGSGGRHRQRCRQPLHHHDRPRPQSGSVRGGAHEPPGQPGAVRSRRGPCGDAPEPDHRPPHPHPPGVAAALRVRHLCPLSGGQLVLRAGEPDHRPGH